MDTHRMATLLQAAGPASIRALGDPEQAQPVGAGGWRRLVDQAIGGHAQLTTVVRQHHPGDREVCRAIREGHAPQALADLQARGRLHAPDRSSAVKELVYGWDRHRQTKGLAGVAVGCDDGRCVTVRPGAHEDAQPLRLGYASHALKLQGGQASVVLVLPGGWQTSRQPAYSMSPAASRNCTSMSTLKTSRPAPTATTPWSGPWGTGGQGTPARSPPPSTRPPTGGCAIRAINSRRGPGRSASPSVGAGNQPGTGVGRRTRDPQRTRHRPVNLRGDSDRITPGGPPVVMASS